jgi:hypothetical protein
VDPVFGKPGYSLLSSKEHQTKIYLNDKEAIEFIVDQNGDDGIDVIYHFPTGLVHDVATSRPTDFSHVYGNCPDNSKLLEGLSFIRESHFTRSYLKDRITQEEPAALSLQKPLSMMYGRDPIQDFVDETFIEYDADGDDLVSLEELIDADNQVMIEQMPEVDINGDNYVTKKEHYDALVKAQQKQNEGRGGNNPSYPGFPTGPGFPTTEPTTPTYPGGGFPGFPGGGFPFASLLHLKSKNPRQAPLRTFLFEIHA